MLRRVLFFDEFFLCLLLSFPPDLRLVHLFLFLLLFLLLIVCASAAGLSADMLAYTNKLYGHSKVESLGVNFVFTFLCISL